MTFSAVASEELVNAIRYHKQVFETLRECEDQRYTVFSALISSLGDDGVDKQSSLGERWAWGVQCWRASRAHANENSKVEREVLAVQERLEQLWDEEAAADSCETGHFDKLVVVQRAENMLALCHEEIEMLESQTERLKQAMSVMQEALEAESEKVARLEEKSRALEEAVEQWRGLGIDVAEVKLRRERVADLESMLDLERARSAGIEQLAGDLERQLREERECARELRGQGADWQLRCGELEKEVNELRSAGLAPEKGEPRHKRDDVSTLLLQELEGDRLNLVEELAEERRKNDDKDADLLKMREQLRALADDLSRERTKVSDLESQTGDITKLKGEVALLKALGADRETEWGGRKGDEGGKYRQWDENQISKMEGMVSDLHCQLERVLVSRASLEYQAEDLSGKLSRALGENSVLLAAIAKLRAELDAASMRAERGTPPPRCSCVSRLKDGACIEKYCHRGGGGWLSCRNILRAPSFLTLCHS